MLQLVAHSAVEIIGAQLAPEFVFFVVICDGSETDESRVEVAGGPVGKSLIKAALGKEMPLPEEVWRRLNWAWVGFFALMGLVNIL